VAMMQRRVAALRQTCIVDMQQSSLRMRLKESCRGMRRPSR
jgi:hypothetical protein